MISQWGNLSLGNSGSYFYGYQNLNLTATDAPNLNGTTTLYQAFRGCEDSGSTGDMNAWNVSSVTNMSFMFANTNNFNQSIDNWNVSSVTDMCSMFYFTYRFNHDLSSWDVSRVTDMSSMFNHARDSNQPLNSWFLLDRTSITTKSAHKMR